MIRLSMKFVFIFIISLSAFAGDMSIFCFDENEEIFEGGSYQWTALEDGKFLGKAAVSLKVPNVTNPAYTDTITATVINDENGYHYEIIIFNNMEGGFQKIIQDTKHYYDPVKVNSLISCNSWD
ncbi:MAG: hypothetical protein KAQ98_07095 [Bacteriovoracaceae bacterium]|nr:hypothetical protein [Bacteriovoracaceae bacterium]